MVNAAVLAALWSGMLASEAVAPIWGSTSGLVLRSVVDVGIGLFACTFIFRPQLRMRVLPMATKQGWGLIAASGVWVLGALVARGETFDGAALWAWFMTLISLGLWAQSIVRLPSVDRQYLIGLASMVVGMGSVGYLLGIGAMGRPPGSDLEPVAAWPLVNPNHSGALFASALVLMAGLLSHRVLVLGQAAERSQLWLLVRPGWHWLYLMLAVGLVAAIVHTGSYSALLVALGGVVLLVLSDHYASLDWVMRRAMDLVRNYSRVVVLGGLALPLLAVLATGLSGAYRGAEVRLEIWRGTLAGLSLEPWAWVWGLGPGRFVDSYARGRQWQLPYPTQVLGPESEWLFVIVCTGVVGCAVLLWFLLQLPWVRLFSRRMGVLSREWSSRVALWALVVVAAQAAVDNTLHTAPMLYWAAMLASMALRTIKDEPKSDSATN